MALFGSAAPSATVVSPAPSFEEPLPVSEVNAWLEETWNSYTRPPTAAFLSVFRACRVGWRESATALLIGEVGTGAAMNGLGSRSNCALTYGPVFAPSSARARQ